MALASWLQLQTRRPVKGHWMYVRASADPPRAWAWAGPVGMLYEAGVGCGKGKKIQEKQFGGREKQVVVF